MVNQQLLEYTKTELRAGIRKDDLIAAIRKAGWQERAIQEVFMEIEKPIAPPVARPVAERPAPTFSPSAPMTRMQIESARPVVTAPATPTIPATTAPATPQPSSVQIPTTINLISKAGSMAVSTGAPQSNPFAVAPAASSRIQPMPSASLPAKQPATAFTPLREMQPAMPTVTTPMQTTPAMPIERPAPALPTIAPQEATPPSPMPVRTPAQAFAPQGISREIPGAVDVPQAMPMTYRPEVAPATVQVQAPAISPVTFAQPARAAANPIPPIAVGPYPSAPAQPTPPAGQTAYAPLGNAMKTTPSLGVTRPMISLERAPVPQGAYQGMRPGGVVEAYQNPTNLSVRPPAMMERSAARPMQKPKKSHMGLWIFLILILLLGGGAGAAYFLVPDVVTDIMGQVQESGQNLLPSIFGKKESSEEVLTKLALALSTVKSASYTSQTSLRFSQNALASSSMPILAALIGPEAHTLKINSKGSIDIGKLSAPRSKQRVDFTLSSGTSTNAWSGSAELTGIGTILYLNFHELKTPLPLDTSLFKDTWIAFDIESGTTSPMTEGALQSARNILLTSDALRLVQEFPDENEGGMVLHHYEMTLDMAKFETLMIQIAKTAGTELSDLNKKNLHDLTASKIAPTVNLWIGAEDYLPYKVEIAPFAYDGTPNGSTFGEMATFSSFDTSTSIEAPASTTPWSTMQAKLLQSLAPAPQKPSNPTKK